jgi:hypothetical protein
VCEWCVGRLHCTEPLRTGVGWGEGPGIGRVGEGCGVGVWGCLHCTEPLRTKEGWREGPGIGRVGKGCNRGRSGGAYFAQSN